MANAASIETAIGSKAVTSGDILSEAGSSFRIAAPTAKPTGVQAAPSMPLPGVGAPPVDVQPAAPPPSPVVKVSTDSPKEERLLGEIRDTLVRISGKGIAHPSRQLLHAT